MRILHVMLSKGKGGLEQAFKNYNQALLDLSHTVYCVVDPKNRDLIPTPLVTSIKNLGPWDLFASLKLKQIINKFKPDLILAHANRAITLLSRFKTNRIPLVGVVHNGRQRHVLSCDAVITVAEHIQKTLKTEGLAKNTLYVLPNMVVSPPEPITTIKSRHPITIGVLARLNYEKGVDLFLDALMILKKTVAFKALIAGDGKERSPLEKQAMRAGLMGAVNFVGWMKDKEKFFNEIDIFCLPSRSEGLPVALLEAFSHRRPVVATATDGSKEVCSHGIDAYLTKANPTDMALYLDRLCQDHETRALFIENAARKVQEKYSKPVFTKTLQAILQAVCHV